MLTLAVLSGPWPRLGVIAAALLAGAAVLARGDLLRAWAMLAAMVLAPALLLDDVWRSAQLHFVHTHPAEAAVGAAVVLAAIGGLAYAIRHHPWLFPVLTMVTLAFRIPINAGGTTSNLLVPLYFVVAASALAWIVPTLWQRHLGRPDAAREPRARRHPFEYLLCLYVLAYAVQALYSRDFPKALQYEVFFYVPFAVLLALLRDVEWDRRLLVRCLTVTAGLAVVYAVIGYGEEITHTLWLNSKLIAENQLHEYFQVNSVFFDPDIFGRYLALVMVLLVTVLLYDPRRRVQIASIITLAVLWGCLIFTLSRSSLVALACGMVVLAAMRWRARPILYAVAVVIVAGAVAVATHPSKFGLNAGLNHASSGRASLISGGVQLFRDKPLQGWGSAAFSVEYQRHDAIAARSVSESHNIPVTVASEQGLIGLVLYLALVVTAIITLLRGARGDPFRVGILAAFLALLAHTMLYADFLEDPVTWTLLGIGGALAAASRANGAAGAAIRRSGTTQPPIGV
ncbi:MAG TPA: O-antigen ligase family protein [Solirubrobacteraceae bacterium]|nr:O-antigen ligase family protein [Solirubrobacteraceae bacterium]